MNFRKPIRKCAAASLFAVLFLASAVAQAAEPDVVSVTATGSGETVAEAKKDAGRNAVLRVVGELTDAETLVENDELVKDRVLTYSGAYLEDMEVVGKPVRRKSTGLVEVTVKATVRKTQLEKKLKAENVAKAEVKKGKLFAQSASRRQEAGDAAAMLEALFENFPSGIVKADVCRDAEGQPAVRVADANGTVEADVEISVDAAAWKDWANEARLKLDKMAASFEDVSWDLSRGGLGIDARPVGKGEFRSMPAGGTVRPHWGVHDDSAGFRLAFATSVREDSSRLSVREYRFDGNNAKSVGDALWSVVPQCVRLDISLLAGGDCLDVRTVRVDGSVFKPTAKWGGSALTSGNANFLLAPAVFGSRELNGSPFFRKARFTVQLGPLSSDSLEDADDVEVKTTFLVPDPKDAGRADWGWVPKPAAKLFEPTE